MAVQTGFGEVHECQINGCDRAAEISQYVNTAGGGRGELVTCGPCGQALRLGERSARGGGLV